MNRLELPVKLVIEEGYEWSDPDEICLQAEVDGVWIRFELNSCPEVGGLYKGSTYTKNVLREIGSRRELYDREGPDA